MTSPYETKVEDYLGDEIGVEIPPIKDPANIVQLEDYKNSRDLEFTSTVEIPHLEVKTETLIPPKSVPEDLKPYLKEKVDNMLSEHKQGKEQRIAKGFEKNSNQAWDKLMEKAPTFNSEELKNKQGEIVDFDLVNNYQELIDKLEQEGEIVNQLGQRVPAETIINDIFKLTYQDLRDFESTDWTKITLKHNLRKAVARLIREYKESEEFKMLGGLDWSKADTIEDLKNVVRQKTAYKNAKNEPVTFRDIINYIDNRQYELLPAVIRFKLKELNRLEEMNLKPQEDTSFKGNVSNWWSKLTSRFTK